MKAIASLIWEFSRTSEDNKLKTDELTYIQSDRQQGKRFKMISVYGLERIGKILYNYDSKH